MSLSNSPMLSATTIWLIHMFSSASLAFFAANILHPHFWRSCNPGPTLQASVTYGSMTLVMQCKKAKDGSGGWCKAGATDCCAWCILDLQPDFQEQQSLVQEVIKAAGHLCIFLPKFHCELNFIEFFWGAVKKYLWTHCDYTFTTLQENMPKALKSIPIGTIWKWEHRMIRWMEAYQSGLEAKEAQIHVKEFSSRCYTSHWQIPESVTTQFDT